MSSNIDHNAELEMYGHAEKRISRGVSHIWENMKFITTAVFFIITATISLFELFQSQLVLFLPSIAIVITVLSFINLRRQYHRFLESILWLNKIEKHLGLFVEIEERDKRLFAEEKHLVPKRFLESGKFKNGEEFIKANLQIRRKTIYSYFAILHVFYVIAEILLLIIMYAFPK